MISVIITAFNKPELERSLVENKELWTDPYYQLILVCNRNKEFLQLLKNINAKNYKVIQYDFKKFNKSRAINIGVYHSNFDIIFLMDADIIIKADTLKERKLSKNEFLTIRKVFESDNNQRVKDGFISEIHNVKRFVTKDGKNIDVPTSSNYITDGSRSGIGQCTLFKKDFFAVNGMNSNLENWGWEDCDLFIRLSYIGLSHDQFGEAIHISHTNRQVDANLSNFRHCLANYYKQNFLGTYDQDIIKF
ncbi:galactosyltransferase-related protein [Ekhidna sp.]|uniref:galactosyltransferase-related protein n=1 Tax=Ekhidna sp. TaxID=2608089 RepID=UPI003CCC1471